MSRFSHLKFRAWSKEQNAMLYDKEDDERTPSGLDEMWGTPWENFCNAWSAITRSENYVLLQWTGYWDRDGKEIFDGDILKLSTAGAAKLDIGLVSQDTPGEYLFAHSSGVTALDEALSLDCLVIGNEFENPELLSEDLREWSALRWKEEIEEEQELAQLKQRYEAAKVLVERFCFCTESEVEKRIDAELRNREGDKRS
jgi:uncharacterized phage protein (TIGR01671 family)